MSSDGARAAAKTERRRYPDPGRYWQMVDAHKISVFYTAPTAIRALMAYGDAPVLKHSRSSLRILGSVGEPINPEAWRWYPPPRMDASPMHRGDAGGRDDADIPRRRGNAAAPRPRICRGRRATRRRETGARLRYFQVVGNSKCAIADTYWQTETGGHVMTPLRSAGRDPNVAVPSRMQCPCAWTRSTSRGTPPRPRRG